MRNVALFTYLFIAISFLASCSAKAIDSSPASIGSDNAKVLIEEFSDFQCPACARLFSEIEELAKSRSDFVRLEFHHYPLPYHNDAYRAAEAAECAKDQGKFWEFAANSFRNQESLSDNELETYALKMGLKTEEYNKCFYGGAKRDYIKNHINDGNKRGLSYTPSIYVNGKLVKWSTKEEFGAYIDSMK